MELVRKTESNLTGQQRDYLLITVFIFSQHGDYIRAKAIIDALIALGDQSHRVILGRAVLEFFCDNHQVTLACLDQLDAAERQGSFQASAVNNRMRQYLRARCYFISGREAEAHEITRFLTSKPDVAKGVSRH